MSEKAFAEQTKLGDALRIAWKQSAFDGVCSHYTTLDRLVDKILTKRWWLTRSTNTRLNDRQEAEKFGNRALLSRTFQTSFSRGNAENVAMWALYTSNDPFAVRIAIPGEVMKTWMKEIRLPSRRMAERLDALGVKGRNHPVYADFKDVIYASVSDPRRMRDEHDKKRANSLMWNGIRSKTIKDLEDAITADECTGWVKDAEWQSEQETRLCVRLEHEKKEDAISIKIPDYVIASMSFTFSPWAKDCDEQKAERIIKTVLQSAKLKITKGSIKTSVPYRRSVVKGALNFESCHMR